MSATRAYASPLITVTELAELISGTSDLVLLDIGSGGRRSDGIPGAWPLELATHFAGIGGGVRGARPLPEIGDLQGYVRNWGVNTDSRIVVYDDKGGVEAARAWWVLRWAGITDVRLLDGGLHAWLAEHSTAPFAPSSPLGNVALSAGQFPVLEADAAARYAAEAVLLDARAPSAFAGDPVAHTGGHIPGAVSAPASGNLDAQQRFLPPDQLRARYANFGVTDRVLVGVTCGSGVSAAHDALALEIIGIRPALFVGSWSAWSADPARPVSYGIPFAE